MSDGPLDTIIAVTGLVVITVVAALKGQNEIALAGVAAIAAYIGSKAVHHATNGAR